MQFATKLLSNCGDRSSQQGHPLAKETQRKRLGDTWKTVVAPVGWRDCVHVSIRKVLQWPLGTPHLSPTREGMCQHIFTGVSTPLLAGGQRWPTRRGLQTLDRERFELDVRMMLQTRLTGWATVTENAPDICIFCPRHHREMGEMCSTEHSRPENRQTTMPLYPAE